MPSKPQVDKIQPENLDRRKKESSPTLSIMQGYENMGPKGRRRLMWIGLVMLTAAGGVGLFATAISFYRFIIVLVFALGGLGLIFPQYGIKMFELVPSMIARLGPDKLFSRPDRRNQE